MKTSAPSLIAAVVILGLSLYAGRLASVEVVTDQRAGVAPQIEQYRVLDTSRLVVPNAQAGPATLEVALNELAAEGWRVRTSVGNTIIFAR